MPSRVLAEAIRRLAPSWPWPDSALPSARGAVAAAAAAAIPAAPRAMKQAALKVAPHGGSPVYDGPEVVLMRSWLALAASALAYTTITQLSPRAAAYFNTDLRGDIDRQMAAAERTAALEGRLEPAGGGGHARTKHTLWWHLAQVKKGSTFDVTHTTHA